MPWRIDTNTYLPSYRRTATHLEACCRPRRQEPGSGRGWIRPTCRAAACWTSDGSIRRSPPGPGMRPSTQSRGPTAAGPWCHCNDDCYVGKAGRNPGGPHALQHARNSRTIGCVELEGRRRESEDLQRLPLFRPRVRAHPHSARQTCGRLAALATRPPSKGLSSTYHRSTYV